MLPNEIYHGNSFKPNVRRDETKISPLFEIALALVRLNHGACAVYQSPTEWQLAITKKRMRPLFPRNPRRDHTHYISERLERSF
jgi:hypothetical protein